MAKNAFYQMQESEKHLKDKRDHSCIVRLLQQQQQPSNTVSVIILQPFNFESGIFQIVSSLIKQLKCIFCIELLHEETKTFNLHLNLKQHQLIKYCEILLFYNTMERLLTID